MKLKIYHKTHYRFQHPVTYGLQQVRKTPKTTDFQSILNWKTDVTGGQKEVSFDDHHNNHTELFSFDRDVSEFQIVSSGEVEISETNGIVGRHRGPAPLWLYTRSTDRTEAKSGVRALMKSMPKDTSLENMHAISATIREAVTYETGVSHSKWTAEEALRAGAGVCQDHTHIFLACARRLGVPARYVSGYLMLNDRTTQEAMHAWAEAYIEGLGWVGFDVSNGISPDTRYVRVATGLDYADASPITGTRTGGMDEELQVTIDVSQQ